MLFDSANKVDSSSPSTSAANGVFNYSELESPILIFLLFHKAFRKELDALHQLAMAFATGNSSDIQPLLQRYHFVRSIYTQHSNAEDEVQFLGSLFTFYMLNLIYSGLFLKLVHNKILLSVGDILETEISWPLVD